MEILYTARFLRSFKKLQKEVQDDVISAVEAFEKSTISKDLKVHKLHGKMKKYFAFSANFSYRVVFKKQGRKVYMMDVGTHDVYQ